ncbi:MAG TPA: ATP-binding protein, partial [Fimbriimonadaceae bacterium]|nr:ATP-binding protein [Fimbriimonadaceae bacterium]
LDLSRIEAGKLSLSLESVSIASAIDQAIDLVGPVAQERGVSLLREAEDCRDLYVKADRQRLVQVLLNLLTNAAKYNRPEGRITVRCSSANPEFHRVEVSDTGRGVDPKAADRLFLPFERGSYAEEGTGLGLALSRRLMELMDGKIRLVETSSAGSTFAVDIPISNDPRSAVEEAENMADKGTDAAEGLLRVVSIEDNLSNVQLLERVFATIGNVELLPAMQASVGLQLIRDHRPDLVLLDLHLPDAHGFEVIKKLKADPNTSSIPVIVLSADATPNQIRRLLEAGAKAYLTKPIDLHTFIAEVNEVRGKTKR